VRKKVPFELRDLLKQPLDADELRAIAQKAGGPEHLVAPKRREEAAGLSGERLLAWLAADGKRVRRPIVEVGGKLTLGFAKDAQEALAKLL
jgi:arsenate reductase-like glutaredoxin family protein